VAACYDIVTAAENWVTVVASGVAPGLAPARPQHRSCGKRSDVFLLGGSHRARHALGKAKVEEG
jgi:hypothetical protein